VFWVLCWILLCFFFLLFLFTYIHLRHSNLSLQQEILRCDDNKRTHTYTSTSALSLSHVESIINANDYVYNNLFALASKQNKQRPGPKKSQECLSYRLLWRKQPPSSWQLMHLIDRLISLAKSLGRVYVQQGQDNSLFCARSLPLVNGANKALAAPFPPSLPHSFICPCIHLRRS
jgi:hypothetical protein